MSAVFCCRKVSLGDGASVNQQPPSKPKFFINYKRSDPEKELVLSCSADQYSVGAVLSKIWPSDSENSSRILSTAEKN